MNKTLCFDLDGTLADLYSVPHWLDMLRSFSVIPYEKAEPLVCCSVLARQLNRFQKMGGKLVIISWSSKQSTKEFDFAVEAAKRRWLRQHLPSVSWDEIFVTSYGENKAEACGVEDEDYILFDDEEANRTNWENMGGAAYSPNEIFQVLAELIRG